MIYFLLCVYTIYVQINRDSAQPITFTPISPTISIKENASDA